MKNRKTLLMVSLVLALVVSLSGTLAYLTDTDTAVNVMTLGNVDIEQYEKDADGNPFEQGQPLYPAYIDNNGAVVGAIDKVVTVENTGKSDAYIRTWIAMEAGSLTVDTFDDIITAEIDNTAYELGAAQIVAIEGVNYYVVCATYRDTLAAGETTTAPSLKRVYMNPQADNADVAQFGDTYEILVCTQAVQTANMEHLTPAEALNTGFGAEHPWQDGVNADPVPELPTNIVTTAEELIRALEAGENVILSNDITLDAAVTVPSAVHVNLNGHTLSSSGLNFTAGGAMENGTIDSAGNTNMVPHVKVSGGAMTMEDVTIVVDDYLNYQQSGNRAYAEITGMEVADATATLKNCHITAENDTVRTWNYLYGLTMNNATVTMEGGSITVSSAGASSTDLETALSAIGNVNITLNGVTVSAETLGTTMGTLVVNTTDRTVTDADFVSYGGTYQLNYID